MEERVEEVNVYKVVRTFRTQQDTFDGQYFAGKTEVRVVEVDNELYFVVDDLFRAFPYHLVPRICEGNTRKLTISDRDGKIDFDVVVIPCKVFLEVAASQIGEENIKRLAANFEDKQDDELGAREDQKIKEEQQFREKVRERTKVIWKEGISAEAESLASAVILFTPLLERIATALETLVEEKVYGRRSG